MASPATNANVRPLAKTGADRARLFSFTIPLQPGERVSDLCQRMALRLWEKSAKPLHVLLFGRTAAAPAVAEAMNRVQLGYRWPMTFVAGDACDGQPVAGIQCHAFTGDVERIERDGRTVGSLFIEGGTRQCVIGGLSPGDTTRSREEQTARTLDDLQAILSSAGFELADTIRTWFFLENILSWYDDFNRARTKIYSGVKFKTGSLPASTGVGAKNPGGAALALAAWACRPLGDTARAFEVASPLQCPAPAYGSSFSRALEVLSATSRRLFISGTASIAPAGQTLWVGDIHKQVEQTMNVVGAILRARGMTFDDLTQATAYFKNPADAGVFTAWLAANRLTQMPVLSAHCDVCRDDLLFELEAEAEENL